MRKCYEKKLLKGHKTDLIVLVRSDAEIPVVVPSLQSTEIVNAVLCAESEFKSMTSILRPKTTGLTFSILFDHWRKL